MKYFWGTDAKTQMTVTLRDAITGTRRNHGYETQYPHQNEE